MSTAIAIFVKTPGLSPIKTRLAAAIGQDAAETFYLYSVKAVEGVVAAARQEISKLVPYWAVAEKTGLSHPLWQGFSRLDQGDGDLGDRLAQVYKTLLSVHQQVILIGADAPQVSQELISKTHIVLKDKNKFVIGPARDGGFYLFGGSALLPKDAWTSVQYSHSKTGEELVVKIKSDGEVVTLPMLSDVDVYDDLHYLKDELKNAPLPTQMAVLHWIETILYQET